MVTVCPSQFATRRTLFHVLVGCGLLMLKVSRLKLPVIWLLVSMWLNTLTKSQIWTLLQIGRASCRDRPRVAAGRRDRGYDAALPDATDAAVVVPDCACILRRLAIR